MRLVFRLFFWLWVSCKTILGFYGIRQQKYWTFIELIYAVSSHSNVWLSSSHILSILPSRTNFETCFNEGGDYVEFQIKKNYVTVIFLCAGNVGVAFIISGGTRW